MSVVAIIPARMASSRFPGKPLADILGLSMIEHVRRRVSLCSILEDRKSTRLNSSHTDISRMPSSA